LSDGNMACLQAVYERAFQDVSLGFHQDLFVQDEGADAMYFVALGSLTYQSPECSVTMHLCGDRSTFIQSLGISNVLSAVDAATGSRSTERENPYEVRERTWLSEAALWLVWTHTSNVQSESYSELVALRAADFQEQVVREHPSAECVRYARAYARFYREHTHLLSDLPADVRVLEELVSATFEQRSAEDTLPHAALDVESCDAVSEDPSAAAAGSGDVGEMQEEHEEQEDGEDHRSAMDEAAAEVADNLIKVRQQSMKAYRSFSPARNV